MVQRTNAARGGRASVSVMKGEVVSSILTGSTTLSCPNSSNRREKRVDIALLQRARDCARNQTAASLAYGRAHSIIGTRSILACVGARTFCAFGKSIFKLA